jgi:transmembrane sensor
MNQSRLSTNVREEASRWWVRLDGGGLSEADRQAFETWREQSPDHRAAFAEICAFWGELDGLESRLFPSSTGAAQTPSAARPVSRQPSYLGWAMAASLLLAVTVIPALMSGAYYQSAVGELRRIALEDGSVVYLGSDSALDVDFGPRQRRLKLRKGEGWFEVAHDLSRPFVVEAGKGSATALGTVFDVKYLNERVQVTVIESRVAVDYGPRAARGGRFTLDAGEQTAYSGESAPSGPHRADLDAVSAWRRGRLIFENQPLGEVIGELNRYHQGLVVIADGSLRDRPVSGAFRTDRPAEVMMALENSLGLKSTRFTDRLILLHR